ncbi:hypothetical protein [Methylobacterium organophilum]|uniref:STAS domain-containing protein n=1 Tax=Methylobacterium organophilum TaxID=410 RepID=A0ABQ4T7K9_METOR|nr:hypothetical protein [Methylobacterium organophilum]UMY16739.1 hypothetical protein MMB17_18990 [Methylobacterium organophilum]GJE27660.1 hypothetical protein LKMONMHP_2520 [Methylobacterium organophilum]
MPLDLRDDCVLLTGHCPIEEAERLLDVLRGAADPVVDLSGLEQAHTAVLQVLMAAAPTIRGCPADPAAAACLDGLPRAEAPRGERVG